MTGSHRLVSTLLACVFFLTGGLLHADEQQDLLNVRQQWDTAYFGQKDKQQVASLASLATEADRLTEQYPNSAGAWIWSGIVHSSLAGAKGGLGALDQVKQARAKLEHALSLQADAMNGAAYTSLGSMYYQVPGWPISFGDEDKARELLQKGLAAGPNDMDAHFFMADFLLKQKEYAEALRMAEKAQALPADPERPLHQQARRAALVNIIEKARRGLE